MKMLGKKSILYLTLVLLEVQTIRAETCNLPSVIPTETADSEAECSLICSASPRCSSYYFKDLAQFKKTSSSFKENCVLLNKSVLISALEN